MAVLYAITIGAIDTIALLHLDTLSGLKELKLCRAYEIDGKQTSFFPANADRLARAQCVYETVEGWEEEITEAKTFAELPANAKKYVELIEKITGTSVSMIGVGPKRSQTIFR